MLKPGNVPKEAIAELRAFLNSCDCDDCVSVAIAAALNAWPGMSHAHNEEGEIKDWATWYSLPWHRAESSNGIILPLPPPPAGEQE